MLYVREKWSKDYYDFRGLVISYKLIFCFTIKQIALKQLVIQTFVSFLCGGVNYQK